MSRYGTAGRFLTVCRLGTAFMATDVGLADLLQCRSRPCASTSLPRCCSPPFFASGADVRPGLGTTTSTCSSVARSSSAPTTRSFFAGQRYVTGGVAAVLLGLVPVVTPALTRLVSTDEEFTVTTALGVVLRFVGVVVIADPGPTNIADSVLGVSLVLASALAFAIAAVVTHSRSPSMPFLSTQAWMMAIGAVVLHAAVLALPSQSFAAATWTPSALGALAYLSAVAGVGGFLLYFTLLDDLGPIEMSFIEYVIPRVRGAGGLARARAGSDARDRRRVRVHLGGVRRREGRALRGTADEIFSDGKTRTISK